MVFGHTWKAATPSSSPPAAAANASSSGSSTLAPSPPSMFARSFTDRSSNYRTTGRGVLLSPTAPASTGTRSGCLARTASTLMSLLSTCLYRNSSAENA